MSEHIHYFAYGSNLHPFRLGARIQSSKFLAVAHLEGYSLRFHKRGADLSGKCNAFYTGLEEDRLPGVVYSMEAAEKSLLDGIEGTGYVTQSITLDLSGTVCTAFAYFAQPDYLDEDLKPYNWYRELVYIGARYHGFSSAYVKRIQEVEAIADHDKERYQANEQLLSCMR